jgi:serine/threonine-protein kinase HipA
MNRSLNLWMNGARLGTWSNTPLGDSLEYSESWLKSEDACPLSLSLPLTADVPAHIGSKVGNYFENLLPDSSDIRERLAKRFGAASTGAFDLLSKIGGDCVGALEILPAGVSSTGISGVEALPLTPSEVAEVLRATTSAEVLCPKRDPRVAIAGAQEKTAMLRYGDSWWLPFGSTPTTHIFKLPMGLVGNRRLDLNESVENEWLCSLILRAYGIPVAYCEPVQFEDQRALMVERFDRTWHRAASDEALVRLPQEDMCQALGMPPHAKYEAEGGAGIDQILALLDGAIDGARDKRIFFQVQILFWMLYAIDGHAKNFSLQLHAGGRYQLTPIYDVLSAYPLLGAGGDRLSPFKVKMAMAVRTKNAHWKMRDILRRHWIAVGERHGIVTVDGRDTAAVIDDLVSVTPQVLQSVRSQLPPGFPDKVADAVLRGLESAADRLST